MSRMKFMNTKIDNLTMNETLQAIDSLIRKKENSYVVTPNVDHIVQLEKDKELQDVYKNASLILTDGKPLLWIAKWYGTPIKEKFQDLICSHFYVVWRLKKDIRCFFWGQQKVWQQKLPKILKSDIKDYKL